MKFIFSAEREADDGLKNYFLETDTFTHLKEGDKSILLGNRGAGKSAIIKMLVLVREDPKAV